MIEYIKSLKWIDYFLFAIVDPSRLLNLINRKEDNPYIIGLIILTFVSLIEILSVSLLGTETRFFYYKITYGWIFLLLVNILLVVILSSLIDFFCQFMDYQGSVKQIINLINISFFPRVFLLPAVFIFSVSNFAPVFFYILCSILLFVWQAFIIIQGISETHQTGPGESLLIFLLPFIFSGVIVFFTVILFFINIIAYISIL